MITGANSGIGLEFAKQYAAKGWTSHRHSSPLASHRRRSPISSRKYPKVRIETLDVTNEAQVHALATKLASTRRSMCSSITLGVYNERGKCSAEDEGCPGTGRRRASAR